jgi:hypothetical protein
LTPPSTLPSSDKADGVTYLREHAKKVEQSSNIAIIGGGAVGVQMATDIKEIYPEKSVTLIHSREQIMNKFKPGLDRIIKDRCEELGVQLKLGSRVKLPANGYPTDGSTFNIELQDGSSVSTDFAVCRRKLLKDELILLISFRRSSLLVKRHSQISSVTYHQNPSMMLVSCVYEGHSRSTIPSSRISLPWEMLLIQELTRLLVRHSDKPLWLWRISNTLQTTSHWSITKLLRDLPSI